MVGGIDADIREKMEALSKGRWPFEMWGLPCRTCIRDVSGSCPGQDNASTLQPVAGRSVEGRLQRMNGSHDPFLLGIYMGDRYP